MAYVTQCDSQLLHSMSTSCHNSTPVYIPEFQHATEVYIYIINVKTSAVFTSVLKSMEKILLAANFGCL